MAAAADDAVCTQWWFQECPFSHTCSHDVWTKKAHRCQSWESEEDARHKLFMHLRWRKEHENDIGDLDDDGIKNFVSTVEIESRSISTNDAEYKDWMAWEEEKKENKRLAADAAVDRRAHAAYGGSHTSGRDNNKRHRGGGDRDNRGGRHRGGGDRDDRGGGDRDDRGGGDRDGGNRGGGGRDGGDRGGGDRGGGLRGAATDAEAAAIATRRSISPTWWCPSSVQQQHHNHQQHQDQQHQQHQRRR